MHSRTYLVTTSITRLWRSKYVRNIATLSSGQLLNAALPLLFAPILGRLYSPKDYGFLGAYISVATVLSAIGNWQYSQGVIFEKSEARARTLISVCLLTSVLTGLVSAFVALLLILMSQSNERWWFVLLPATIVIGGISACLIALANRRGHYHRIATIQILPTLLSILTSVGLGLQKAGSTGLMIAYFIGQIITLGLVVRSVKGDIAWRKLSVPLNRLLTVAIKHRRFPIYTLPSNFISSLTLNSPVYALQYIGAIAEIGLYSRANQLLSMPFTLLGGSVAQVYQRQAAEEFKNRGNCWSVYKRTLLMLIAGGSLPCLLLFAFAPQLFRFVLGPDWEDAGQIARLLSPMLFLRLVCSPLATTFYVVGAQREDFFISTGGYLLVAVAMLGILGFGGDCDAVIAGFSACYCAIYSAFIFRSVVLSRKAKAANR